MHISDGVLPIEVAAGTGAAATALGGVLLARLDAEKVPRVALCTSFFFVASLVHIPAWPTSVHLTLIGLVGILMGPWAFLPIGFGLLLQALLFEHGGLSALGANALVMGLPAYAAWAVFRQHRRFPWARGAFLFGFAAGWTAVLGSLLLLKTVLELAGSEFAGVAWTAFVVYQPLALIEGIVTGFAASLMKRVEPQIFVEAGHA